ncbi:DPP IV N-terminal domain-containing protein [Nonomuraea sp. NPDC050643]|uniref:S9 family peptidase n=1 Tax=Nonomuraea sp. NPDC050643 TaxID=3155660 RepID=UPI0033CED7F6
MNIDLPAYEAAERLSRQNRPALVRKATITPQWIGEGPAFWYAVDGTFVLVDPPAGTREPAFDHARLAAGLAAASGHEVDPAALPFGAISWTTDAIGFDAFGHHWRCSLDTYTCERAPGAPPAHPLEIPSPDGRLVAFRKGHDLWVRSLADGRERPLTSDGDADHDYGASPDFIMYASMFERLGLPHAPPAVSWSPDSTRILTHRTLQEGVRRVHLIESMPPDGGDPRLRTKRAPRPGDERIPLAEYVVIDVAAGTVVRAQADPVAMPFMLSPVLMRWAWWSGSAVYFLSWPRDMRTLRLNRLDPVTGEVRTLVTETGDTRVEPTQQPEEGPIVGVLSGGDELLWYSQRDGWGHLYRYDARTGEPLGRVTSGPWAVRRILRVDEDRRVVYFLASGLVAADPYRRSVCRVNLDGSGFARLTGDLDHEVTVSPDGGYFVATASAVDTPQVTTVRDWDGRVLAELERADVSALLQTGWTPPERFRVKAADGVTDVYGVLHRPHGFDPARRYPVVDHVYPFPATQRVSPSFDPGWHGYDAEALAALGFVVIAMDGRGTPGRDKAFHDASYGRMEDGCGLADHVAALEQLAAARPWMDTGRVGVFGISAGGFGTVRAMLDFPGVFKAGVAASGLHDFRYGDPWTSEAYQGPYDEAGYARASNVDHADRLKGRLLLIHGGLDDQVAPDLTLRLLDRLIAADKDVDLLIVPGADHVYTGYERYVNRRVWDFFLRHLLDEDPPGTLPS